MRRDRDELDPLTLQIGDGPLEISMADRPPGRVRGAKQLLWHQRPQTRPVVGHRQVQPADYTIDWSLKDLLGPRDQRLDARVATADDQDQTFALYMHHQRLLQGIPQDEQLDRQWPGRGNAECE